MSAAWTAAAALGALAAVLSLRAMYECGAAEAGVVRAFVPRSQARRGATLRARAGGGVRRRPALPAALVIGLVLAFVVGGGGGERAAHPVAAAVVHVPHHRAHHRHPDRDARG
jgi:hypothetical protein